MKMNKKILYAALTLTVMIFIFMFSAQNADTSSNTSTGFTKAIARIVMPGQTQGQIDSLAGQLDMFVRKGAHFSIYAVLGLFACLFFGEYKFETNAKYFIFPIALCMLYAVTDEVHQYFVPGRACRLLDVFIDTCGAVVGTAAINLFKRNFKK